MPGRRRRASHYMSTMRTAWWSHVRTRPSTPEPATSRSVRLRSTSVRTPNGSILIDYKAADPFSPGGGDLALSSPFNVNGQLAIKPTEDGPIAGGFVSSFPAIEIYHHGAAGTSEIAKIMPQNISQAGPLLGLPLSQNIGVSLMGEFPDTVLPPLPRVPDLDVGPDNDPPVLQIPEPFVIPYPAVELRPIGDGVNVPVGR
jgi:hypothetical protein